MGWVLAVDFGTSNTGAATRRDRGDGPPVVQVVRLSSNHDLMPSGVLRNAEGLCTGEYARRSALTEQPGSYEPNPKICISKGDAQILLGGVETEVVDLAKTILEDVTTTARRWNGNQPPSQLVLTHPAAWAQRRLKVLNKAAERAGLPKPILVPEPEAAAAYYAANVSSRHNPNEIVAIYDLGGGTLDLALLKVEDSGNFHLIDNAGIDDCGGEKFDRVIRSWVATHLEDSTHLDQLDLAQTRTLTDSITHAKERLSDYPTAKIAVPGHPDPLVLTRNTLEALIQGDLIRSIDLLEQLLQRNQLTPDRIAHLYLTGGSSRIQLVSHLLRERLHLEPTPFDDPKLVVCQGALYHPTTPSRAIGGRGLNAVGHRAGDLRTVRDDSLDYLLSDVRDGGRGSGEVDCPNCDFRAKSPQGLASHRRNRHPNGAADGLPWYARDGVEFVLDAAGWLVVIVVVGLVLWFWNPLGLPTGRELWERYSEGPVQPEPGRPYWALYFAVAPPGASELDAAVAEVERLGFSTAPGSVGCDIPFLSSGASSALGVPDDYRAVALYFRAEQDARRFANLSRLEPVDLRLIRTNPDCLQQ